MDPLPLLLLASSLLLAFIAVYLAEWILWNIYDPQAYIEAVSVLEEVGEKLREARASRDKRLERRVKLLEARVEPLRSLIVRVTLTRGILYTFAYLATGGILTLLFPYAFPAPAPIPLVTFEYNGAVWFAAPQAAMLATIVAIMVLMGPGRLRTVEGSGARRGGG